MQKIAEKTKEPASSVFRIPLLTAVAAVALASFVLSNLAALNQNDFMYAVAPAVWAQNGALYTDVPYPQAPLSILLNSLLVALIGNVNVFLVSRIVSMGFVFVAVLLPVLDRSKLRDVDTWILYVALCITNYFVISNSREIGNYALSLFCLSASLTVIARPGSPLWRGFVAFAFVGLAASAKLYFIIISPALFLFLLFIEPKARHSNVFAACAVGLVLGLAPVLYFLARDHQSFLQWTVRFFQMIMPSRLADTADAVRRIANMLTLFATLMAIPIGFFAVALWKAWREGGDELKQKSAQFILLGATCAMAVSPIILFGQYFGPLAFLLLLFSAPWNSSDERTRSLYKIFAGAMFCMQCVVLAAIIGPDIVRDGNVAMAEVLKVQKEARRIVVNDYRCDRRLYSTVPLFLLENEVKYPPELVAGPFLMFFLRGDALAQKGEEFDLKSHIEKWNPDVVIWGYFLDSNDNAERAVDGFIRDFAIGHQFVTVPLGRVDGHDITLGYRSGCKSGATK